MFDLAVPPAIEKALSLGAAVAVSISGGKDSQGIIKAIAGHRGEHGTPAVAGPVFAIHAHLGRAEWRESLPMCERLAADYGMELVVARRKHGDLFEQIVARAEKLRGTGKPFWPSSAARYCTSDNKRGPINSRLIDYPLVISVEGIRAEESPARRKKPVVEVRATITTKKLKNVSPADAVRLWEPGAGRLALDWYPIHHWTEREVYEYAGHSLDERNHRRGLYQAGNVEEALDGWGMHPAYVYGNDRVSCNACVLASGNDLSCGARHNPAAFQFLRGLETQTGFTFKNGWSLEVLDSVTGKFPCPVCGQEAAFSYSETHWRTDCPHCQAVYNSVIGQLIPTGKEAHCENSD